MEEEDTAREPKRVAAVSTGIEVGTAEILEKRVS